jgi:hypothetical protein
MKTLIILFTFFLFALQSFGQVKETISKDSLQRQKIEYLMEDVQEAGSSLKASGIMQMLSVASGVGGAFLVPKNKEAGIALVAIGGLTYIGSIVFKISAGNVLSNAGAKSVEVGLVSSGVGLTMKF